MVVQTPNWQLEKPTVGADRDVWGGFLNGDLDSIDTIMAALMPVGSVIDFAGGTAPSGWVICDGSVFPIATYPKLAAVLGNTYGGAVGSTFAVPDCRGRVTAGVGVTTDSAGLVSGYPLAYRYGYFLVTLSTGNLPPASITINAGGDHIHTGNTDGQGLHSHNGATDGQGLHTHTYQSATVNTPAAQMAPGSGFSVSTPTSNTSSDGLHAHNITTTQDGFHGHGITTFSGGSHTHTATIAGSNAPVDVRNPMIALNKIIFAGPPGFTSLSSPIPGAPALMQSPMRGG